MSANLRFITHASKRDTHERSVCGLGNRLREGGFAHTGRANEREDRALAFATQLQHGHMLHDAALHVVEAEMIGIKLGFDGIEIGRRLRADIPRKVGNPLEVGADDVALRLIRPDRFEATQFAIHDIAHVLWKVSIVELLAEAILGIVFVAKLLLDGAHLLTQHRFLLILADVLADLRVDFLAQLSLGAGLSEQLNHEAKTGHWVEREEDFDLPRVFHIEPCRNAIREHARLTRCSEHLGHRGIVGREFAKTRLEAAHQLVGFRSRDGLHDFIYPYGPVWNARRERTKLDARERIDDQHHAALTAICALRDARQGCDGMKVNEGWVFGGGVTLHAEDYEITRLERLCKRTRTRTAHRNGRCARGQHNAMSEWQERKRLGHIGHVLISFCVSRTPRTTPDETSSFEPSAMPERCLRELVRCGKRDVKTRPDPVTPPRNREMLTQCFFEDRPPGEGNSGHNADRPKRLGSTGFTRRRGRCSAPPVFPTDVVLTKVEAQVDARG